MKQLFAALAVIIIVFSCRKEAPPPPPTAPTVTTAALTNITSIGATGGGSIVSNGGATVTKSGVVWSKTNSMPTLTDSVIAGTSATGTFTCNITGLDFNNTYYVRAFATNSVGTGYGSVVTLNTANDETKVRFNYNGEEVVYGVIVSSTTGRKWLDRNLGAKRVASSYDDYQAYGDLFQWGRPDDGHQLINWTTSRVGAPVNTTTTETRATSDTPGHNTFIIITDFPADWRNDDNHNRWYTNPQGPCPAGWHVPRDAEWRAEMGDPTSGGVSGGTPGGITYIETAYDKLKLTMSGFRNFDGRMSAAASTLGGAGIHADYWSSSLTISNSTTYGDPFGFQVSGGGRATINSYYKVDGLSVRCIKD